MSRGGAGFGSVSILSVHDNNKEDRVFDFTCIPLILLYFPETFVELTCEWSNYVNDFDQLIEYQCPNDNVVAGISSYHDNHPEDRRFKFYCCRPNDLVTHGCEYTGYVNSYDQLLNYTVPDGWVLRGMTSVHDNSKNDRIFQFDVCRLDRLQLNPGASVVG
ncbi:hemagglutinin/amebocyte aggregation factor [Aplysia californica]|uniref:Hemagglutinin/amebocyte aggregation factor n=1 Tax=Aplysia californica TaxID=6500 RepID=A0ABM0JRG2_APLCA|nr:hemagglutinin/amebocyte aggregation factor [Aplysia californica]